MISKTRRALSKLVKEEFRVKQEQALKHVFDKEQEANERKLDYAIPYKSQIVVEEAPKKGSLYSVSPQKKNRSCFS